MADNLTWINRRLAHGRYRITAQLGEGGMGFVFSALDANLNCDVVIKVPRAELLQDMEFKKRFAQEIRALVQLSHPHIVKITDVGEDEGVPFAVMQYLPGGSLEQLRAGGNAGPGTPETDDVSWWLGKVGETLDFIHGQGVVHRDIKPANILLDGHRNVYLSDFGIAKAIGGGAPTRQSNNLTGTGLILGTIQYMAPELLMGEGMDGRVDQYALGVTVFEILTGRLPLDGPTAVAIGSAHLNKEPLSLLALRPSLPEELGEAVARSLAKDPNNRFPTCAAFAQACAAALQHTPAAGRGSGGRAFTSSRAPTGPVPAASRRPTGGLKGPAGTTVEHQAALTAATPRRSGRRLVVGAVVAVLLAGGALGAWWQFGSRTNGTMVAKDRTIEPRVSSVVAPTEPAPPPKVPPSVTLTAIDDVMLTAGGATKTVAIEVQRQGCEGQTVVLQVQGLPAQVRPAETLPLRLRGPESKAVLTLEASPDSPAVTEAVCSIEAQVNGEKVPVQGGSFRVGVRQPAPRLVVAAETVKMRAGAKQMITVGVERDGCLGAVQLQGIAVDPKLMLGAASISADGKQAELTLTAAADAEGEFPLMVQGRVASWPKPLTGQLRVSVNNVTKVWARVDQLAKQRKFPEALAEAKIAVDLDGSTPEALLRKAKVCLQADKLEEARTDCQNILQVQKKNKDAHYLLAQVLAREGNYEEAIPSFNAAWEEARDKDAVYLARRGAAYVADGQYAKAIPDLELALIWGPKEPPILANLAAAFGGVQKFEQALKTVDSVLQANAKIAEAYRVRGDVYRDMAKDTKYGVPGKMLEKAIQGYTDVLKLDAQDVYTLLARGLIYYGQQNKAGDEKALKDFDDAIRVIEPRFQAGAGRPLPRALRRQVGDLYYHRGKLHAFGSRHDQAIQDFDQAIKAFGFSDDSLRVFRCRAQAERALARSEKKEFDAALAELQDIPPALRGLGGKEASRALAYQGYIYFRMGKLPEAGRLLDQAIAGTGRDWGWPLYVLALVRTKQDLRAQAQQHLQDAAQKGCNALLPVTLGGLGER